MFENAPFDNDGFTLTDRWYCKETSTWYPVGTSRREIEQDMNDESNHRTTTCFSNGEYRYLPNGHEWTDKKPCMMVKCNGGWLIAYQVGDPGIYDEIAVDFVADDGRCLQMVTVGMSEGDEFMSDDEDMAMHVYVWDGMNEELQHSHYVHIDEDSCWY